MATEPEGLTGEQAKVLLKRHGPNELRREAQFRVLREIAQLFTSPLILLLLAATVVSASLGHWTDAFIVLLMVVLSAGLNFIQTYRAHRSVELLREEVAPVSVALRDGEWAAIPRRELVPGDLVRLEAGSQVPADGPLTTALHLHVEEAALTGESLPVEKQAGEPVYQGTSVVSGRATLRVDATGTATQFGAIALRLASRRPPSEFEHGLERFSLLIAKTSFLLVISAFAACTFAGRPPAESLLFSIALAVGMTPEFLPFISTLTLGRGAVRMASSHVVVKNLAAIQNFGSIDILCSDKTGTLTSGRMTFSESLGPDGIASQRPVQLAAVNAALQSGPRTPLDEAILRAAPQDQLPCKWAEIPFDFERRRVSVLAAPGMLITKGAPESLLPVCALDDLARERVRRDCDEFAKAGMRVLAVAHKRIDGSREVDVGDESGMELDGLLAFEDPPLEDAGDAIAQLARDGVRIKILTGDNELVAARVAQAVGMDAGEIVLGSDVAAMADDALGHAAERATIFARVSPVEKNRIIRALKLRGHVVGYVGDGINDAPSLHAADVGISVANAVEVARDAADIILRERGLRVLHTGILEGRHAFANVLKYLLMGTSSNFGNMFSMAAASMFLPFLPMLPAQILLNNFLYDTAQVPIPSDRVDPAMLSAPRRWDISFVRTFMVRVGPISSLFDFLTFGVLLHFFDAGERLFQTGWFVESLMTQTLVLVVIRTPGRPWRNLPSPWLAGTIAAVSGAGAILPLTPVGPALGFVAPPLLFYLYVGAATVCYLAVVEVVKRRTFASRW